MYHYFFRGYDGNHIGIATIGLKMGTPYIGTCIASTSYHYGWIEEDRLCHCQDALKCMFSLDIDGVTVHGAIYDRHRDAITRKLHGASSEAIYM
jgi:hypothetical protein